MVGDIASRIFAKFNLDGNGFTDRLKTLFSLLHQVSIELATSILFNSNLITADTIIISF